MNDVQLYAQQFVEDHGVPAVNLAVWRDGMLEEGAFGVLNLRTGVEATTDSVFQIGSITKAMTATLVMQLMEKALIDLDEPLCTYLRDFELVDRAAATTITIRHLLNHTNGIAGDYFWDDAKSEGPHLSRFIDRCSQLPLVHPVGEAFSYSNVGFALLGRLAEVVSGRNWEALMEEEIFAPLEMTHALCRPEASINYRVALGSIATGEDSAKWRPSSGKFLCLGQAPAGTTPTMRPADLIRFARAHMDVDHLSERLLKVESRALMQTPSADIPVAVGDLKNALGLGWFVYSHAPSGVRFFGHSGSTNGQCAALRIFPEHNTAFAAMMNCQDNEAFTSLVRTLTKCTAGIDIRPIHETAGIKSLSADALRRCAGRYSAYAGEYHVDVLENGLKVHWEDFVDEEPDQQTAYRYIGDDAFAPCNDNGALKAGAPLHFLAPDKKGAPQRLFSDVRLFKRMN